MPFLLSGGPVSLPVGTSTMTTLIGFSLCQRVVTFPFSFSNATDSSGGHFLPPAFGLGGCSDVEVAALKLLDPATLNFVLAVLVLFLHMLRLVLSITPTKEMDSKSPPSPLASFSEGFS
jgi:hypothetical protein